MRQYLNPHTIANEARMRRLHDNDAPVLIIDGADKLEGNHLQELLRLLDNQHYKILLAYTKQNVIDTLRILINEGQRNFYAALVASIDLQADRDVLPRIAFAHNWYDEAFVQKLLGAANQNVEQNSKIERISTPLNQPLVVAPEKQETPNVIQLYVSQNIKQQFIDEIRTKDWRQEQPETLIVALEGALKMELPELAIKIAQIGKDLFPNNERIQQAGRILAPPVIRISQASSPKNLGPSRMWLLDNATSYKGQWIAVSNGVLLGAEPSLEVLLLKYETVIDRSNTIVTKVL